jgi:Arc/MetJ family transcription regulator
VLWIKVGIGRGHNRLRRDIALPTMAKHLIELDEAALNAARAELGTTTIKDTVNAALRRATTGRQRRVARALHVLAKAQRDDRAAAWR